MFSVVITEKGGAQRRLEFDKNEVTIGRVQGNDIILPKGNVSKRHSRIVLKDNRFIVVDLKSTNGTYVNGRKITSPLVVKAGDKIFIGDFILTLEEGGTAGVGADAGSPMAASAPMGPPPMPAPMSAPVGGPGPLAAPPLPAGPAPMPAPPPLAAAPHAPAAPPVLGERRPPPLHRSAPPPPRHPTLAAGGMGPAPHGGPPPLPPRGEAPRMPSEPPPPARHEPLAAERYPLEEDPADETMAPSPRVVPQGRAAPASRPEPPKEPAAPVMPSPAPVPTDLPPSRQGAMAPAQPAAAAPPAVAPVAAPPAPSPPVAAASTASPAIAAPPAVAPVAAPPAPSGPVGIAAPASPAAIPLASAAARPRRPVLPRPRDVRDPVGYVLARVAESFDIGDLTPPEAVEPERWHAARAVVDAAIQRLERDGGHAGDRESLASAAVQEVLGLGALGPLLDDPGVLEIVIEGPASVLVDRGAGLVSAPGRFSSADQLTTIVGRLLTRAGQVFDASRALHDATLPDGAHLTAILPPVALRGPVVEIRRTGRAPVTGESLVQQGLLSSEMLGTLRAAVAARRNVVVLGPSDVGVSTVVSMIANLAPSDERVLAIEDAPELALAAPHVVRLQASTDVPLSHLLATAPRLRADRLVIDGVGGAEARAALLVLAGRGAGAVLGIRCAASGDALEHLEALASLGGSAGGLGRLIAAAAHVLVKVGRDANGVRRILSIAEVLFEDDVPSARDIHQHAGSFLATGHRPSFEA